MKRAFLLCMSVVVIFGVEGATYTGTIFCDNWFKLFVNGKLVKVDPVNFTPHQAVSFSFEDDQPCRTYAIYATDSGDDATGLEYDNTCVGDGGIKITLSDGTVSSSQWKAKVIQRGPTNWETCYSTNKLQKCRSEPATKCTTETLSYDTESWCLPQYTDSGWSSAVEHSDQSVGYGKAPVDKDSTNCVDPRTVSWGNAKFIWTDDLDYDNKLLFRYTKCDNGAVNTVSVTDQTCPMDKPESSMTCGGDGSGRASYKGVSALAIFLGSLIFFI